MGSINPTTSWFSAYTHADYSVTTQEFPNRIIASLQERVSSLLSTLWASAPFQKNSSSVIPDRCILYGRNDIVHETIEQILSQKGSCLALVGPAGIGKTSIATELLYSDRIVEEYSGRRHWIACHRLQTIGSFLDAIVDALSLPLSAVTRSRILFTQSQSLAVTHTDVLTSLDESLSERHEGSLLILDGFDSIWEQTSLQDSLARIVELLRATRRVTIILTIRDDALLPFVDWSQQIGPLSKDAAVWLFQSIMPDYDEDLYDLVEGVNCLPQAIISLARASWMQGVGPHELLQQGITGRMDLPDVGENLSVVKSKGYPDLLQIIDILSLLPDGIEAAEFATIAPQIRQIEDRVRILTQHSLAFLNSNQRLQIPSPIRTYRLQYHPLDAASRQNLYEYYFSRTRRVASVPGDTEFLRRVHFVMEHEGNIFAVLEDALGQDCEKALEAFLENADLLGCTTARPRVASKAVNAARKLSSAEMLSRCLEWEGQVNQATGNLRLAQRSFEEAKDIFYNLGDRSAAARCKLSLGTVLTRCGDKDVGRLHLEAARREAALCNDKSLEVQCLLELTETISSGSRIVDLSRWRDIYEEPRAILASLHDDTSIGFAWYNYHMSSVHLEFDQLSEAETVLHTALKIFKRNQDHSAVARCLWQLGGTVIKDVPTAIECLEESLGIYHRLGRRLDAALVMNGLARRYTASERYEDAIDMFKAAIPELWHFEFVWHAARCQYYMGVLYLQMDRLVEARLALMLSRRQHLRHAVIAPHEEEPAYLASASLAFLVLCYKLEGDVETARMLLAELKEECVQESDGLYKCGGRIPIWRSGDLS